MRQLVTTLLAPVFLALALAFAPAAHAAEPATADETAAEQQAPDPSLAPSGVHIQAVRGMHAHGFCYGVTSKDQLISLIGDAYQKDKTGNSRLDPKVCGPGRATPRNYLESFSHHDPKAGLRSVDQMLGYLRALVVDCHPPRDAQWYTDAIEDNGRTFIDFMTRDFGPGECGLKNPLTGKFVLFFKCANPIGEKYVPPLVAEVQVPALPVPRNCYHVNMDYRQQPDVLVNGNGSARVTVHVNLSAESWQRLKTDKCFGVAGIGESAAFLAKVSEERCDGCLVGSYPKPALAAVAGLPATKPSGTFSFWCKGAACYLSLPQWVVDEFGGSVYCVNVVRYGINVYGFYRYTSDDRWSIVVETELARTKAAGELDRTLRGAGHFPSLDRRPWPQ